jgi:hypothetical protein
LARLADLLLRLSREAASLDFGLGYTHALNAVEDLQAVPEQ